MTITETEGNIFQLNDYDRRGHSKKLFKKRSRLDVGKFTFSNRIVELYLYLI